MKKIKHFIRLIDIGIVLVKHRAWRWFGKNHTDRGTAIRLTCETLGPIFVKFGQVLSTRQDMLPKDIGSALISLQDNVPCFPSEEARSMIERALKKPINQLFLSFDNTPLAAASIAQVHSAVLPNGKSVVVKVLRPHIRKKIQQDIDLLYALASLAEYHPKLRRLKPKAIVNEFRMSLLEEIDLQREAGNASQLRHNFSHSPLLYIPEIVWEYTSHHVMTMEKIDAIPVSDRKALLDYQMNMPKLAANLIELFFTQVFRDAFFHADMHPGNIFVSKKHPHHPKYICVDFGIIGTLSDRDRRYIAENFHAFFNRDYRRVAELHRQSGWIDSDTQIDRFESAIRAVSEPIFEKPLKDISFAEVIFNLIKTARRFHIHIQPQLILLQKTLLSVEGLARTIDPNLDLWTTAKPFLEKWINEQIGLKTLLRNTKKQLPFLIEHLPELPQLLYEFLEKKTPIQLQHKKNRLINPFNFLLGSILGGGIVYIFFL